MVERALLLIRRKLQVAIVHFQAQRADRCLAHAAPLVGEVALRIPASGIIAVFALDRQQLPLHPFVPVLPDVAALLEGTERAVVPVVEIELAFAAARAFSG